ncbi:MAG: restriction endonuclease subunit S [Duncaniella sp.]|nr:restriction endonuclease subunit S [Duncaniella sp.]
MNHNWEYYKFGTLCEIVRGGSPRPIQSYLTDSEDGLNWIKIGDVAVGSKYISSTKEKIIKEGLAKTRQVFKGDFLLSNSMSFGRPYILNIDGCIHDGWLAIKGVEKYFIPDFLYYFLSSHTTYALFEKLVRRGIVSNLNSDIVRGIDVPVPPMTVQEQIVAELDRINDLITKNRELLTHLDSLTQSVFYDTFGDTITNPKGWEVYSLEECVSPDCSISYGIVQPGEDYVNGVPVVRPVDFTHSRFVSVNNLKCINPEISDSYKRTILCGNEILICVRGTTGLVRLADMSLAGCNVTRGIVPLMFPVTISRTYLYEYLKQDRPQDFIKFYTRGTTLKQINLSDLRKLPLLLPPLALQEEFARKVEAIEAQKAKVETEIAELETLRDTRMDYWFA